MGVWNRKGALLQEQEEEGEKGVNSCELYGEDPQNRKAHMHCRP